ncbi:MULTISPECIES: hypothetical protein [unclassified Oceanobacter]|uniref:hypothetical protein n=1 Tax=unclassified Oceanobacter TaxID=2620260 RepID=UPI0027328B6C|nr:MULTISPECIES: hypothetical protein [unclassified Oceanobacter]MDP2610490.1 hypothetical protein [Oceanobacter sp. 1_MG-2023]MDP2613748.1 hypothetical protein [Oceanobacter sp. 2_MG-2023]
MKKNIIFYLAILLLISGQSFGFGIEFSPITDPLADLEGSVREEAADAEDTVRDDLADAEDTVRDELADAEDTVRDELADAEDAAVQFGSWLDDRRPELGIHNDEEEDSNNNFALIKTSIDFDNVYVETLDNRNIDIYKIENSYTKRSITWEKKKIFWGGVTIWYPKLVTIHIDSTPEPYESKDSISDKDQDVDGVYDDLEYFIYSNIDDYEIKTGAYRLANSVMQMIENPDNEERFFTATVNYRRALDCLKDANPNFVYALKLLSMASQDRFAAFIRMEYTTGTKLIAAERLGELTCQG